jgi:hypothetical protein
LTGLIQPQGLHYNAPNDDGERTRLPGVTTYSKKPRLRTGIKYDKIPLKSDHAGELGLKRLYPTIAANGERRRLIVGSLSMGNVPQIETAYSSM